MIANTQVDLEDQHIDPYRIDLQKYNTIDRLKQHEAKLLVLYMLYHTHTPKVALDLASICTTVVQYNDYIWKNLLGRIYYQLGMYRDAEKQLLSSIKQSEWYISTYHYKCKIYIKLDQPQTALEWYKKGIEKFGPQESSFLIGIARIYELLLNYTDSLKFYKQVLQYNAMNVESIACIANANFYIYDSPEISLRYYNRLHSIGVNSCELWNNIGLSAFYSNQYDLSLNSFFRSFQLAQYYTSTTSLSSSSTSKTEVQDENPMLADIWYNLSLLAIQLGDINLCIQMLKISISINRNHWESWNNLGVLELRKGHIDIAKTHFIQSSKLSEGMQGFEGLYNTALLAYKLGDFQESYQYVQKSLQFNPTHSDSLELVKQLKTNFTAL